MALPIHDRIISRGHGAFDSMIAKNYNIINLE